MSIVTALRRSTLRAAIRVRRTATSVLGLVADLAPNERWMRDKHTRSHRDVSGVTATRRRAIKTVSIAERGIMRTRGWITFIACFLPSSLVTCLEPSRANLSPIACGPNSMREKRLWRTKCLA
jgi:hypothetical protein